MLNAGNNDSPSFISCKINCLLILIVHSIAFKVSLGQNTTLFTNLSPATTPTYLRGRSTVITMALKTLKSFKENLTLSSIMGISINNSYTPPNLPFNILPAPGDNKTDNSQLSNNINVNRNLTSNHNNAQNNSALLQKANTDINLDNLEMDPLMSAFYPFISSISTVNNNNNNINLVNNQGGTNNKGRFSPQNSSAFYNYNVGPSNSDTDMMGSLGSSASLTAKKLMEMRRRYQQQQQRFGNMTLLPILSGNQNNGGVPPPFLSPLPATPTSSASGADEHHGGGHLITSSVGSSATTYVSRTSILFVSISFIVLMIISLAWLVFYYVQRFRYAHAKDQLAKRLNSAAKKALVKIPLRTVKSDDKVTGPDSDTCAVCIEGFKQHEIVRELKCGHYFHKACVDTWLLLQRSCPICKMDILEAYGLSIDKSRRSTKFLCNNVGSGGTTSIGGISLHRHTTTGHNSRRHHHGNTHHQHHRHGNVSHIPSCTSNAFLTNGNNNSNRLFAGFFLGSGFLSDNNNHPPTLASREPSNFLPSHTDGRSSNNGNFGGGTSSISSASSTQPPGSLRNNANNNPSSNQSHSTARTTNFFIPLASTNLIRHYGQKLSNLTSRRRSSRYNNNNGRGTHQQHYPVHTHRNDRDNIIVFRNANELQQHSRPAQQVPRPFTIIESSMNDMAASNPKAIVPIVTTVQYLQYNQNNNNNNSNSNNIMLLSSNPSQQHSFPPIFHKTSSLLNTITQTKNEQSVGYYCPNINFPNMAYARSSIAVPCFFQYDNSINYNTNVTTNNHNIVKANDTTKNNTNLENYSTPIYMAKSSAIISDNNHPTTWGGARVVVHNPNSSINTSLARNNGKIKYTNIAHKHPNYHLQFLPTNNTNTIVGHKDINSTIASHSSLSFRSTRDSISANSTINPQDSNICDGERSSNSTTSSHHWWRSLLSKVISTTDSNSKTNATNLNSKNHSTTNPPLLCASSSQVMTTSYHSYPPQCSLSLSTTNTATTTDSENSYYLDNESADRNITDSTQQKQEKNNNTLDRASNTNNRLLVIHKTPNHEPDDYFIDDQAFNSILLNDTTEVVESLPKHEVSNPQLNQNVFNTGTIHNLKDIIPKSTNPLDKERFFKTNLISNVITTSPIDNKLTKSPSKSMSPTKEKIRIYTP